MKTNRMFVILLGLSISVGWTSCNKNDQVAPVPSNIIQDSAVSIENKGTYYLVTLDMTQGFSHYRIGQQYGRCIKKVVTDYETILGAYLYELATYQYIDTGNISERIGNIKPQLDANYRDEMDGIVSQFNGTSDWSAYEIVYGINLVSDVFRYTQCSAFGCWGEASKTGENIAYRTLDWYGGSVIPTIQSVTKIKYPDKTIYLIGILGHLGCITGINYQNGIMAAILDADVETSYQSPGLRSYIFDLRKALETESTKEGIADYLKKPEFAYAFDHIIFLADETNCMILENNISNAGIQPQRAIRVDTSDLNPGISWNYKNIIGAVNCFMLHGQVNNFSVGINGIINTQRWDLLLQKTDNLLQLNNNQLSAENVREIMCSYWGEEPASLYMDNGDLYNTDTQQMARYIPARRSLKVFFKPKDNSTPKDPSPYFETIVLSD
jgi:hypothetical protein